MRSPSTSATSAVSRNHSFFFFFLDKKVQLDAGGGVFGGDGEASAIWDIWGRQIEPVAAYYPYMISLGNHESSYNYTAFKARHEMPGQGSGGQGNQFYSFDHGLVHFVSMSSENDAAPYAVGSPQYNFLRAVCTKFIWQLF